MKKLGDIPLYEESIDPEEDLKRAKKILTRIRGFNPEQHWTVESLCNSIHGMIDESQLLPELLNKMREDDKAKTANK